MAKIKVSIIVPVYNVEEFLPNCIDSLINQTLKDIEIILVDDCSSDNSGKICDEYDKKDSRIIVIHNEQNIKQGASRNKGIDIAKGEYIGFVDSDDWVDLDFYEKLYNKAKEKNYDIVKGGRIDYNNQTGEKKIELYLTKNIENNIKNKLPLAGIFTYEHWSAIYKRKFLIENNIRYTDYSNAQDMLFLFKICSASPTIAVINDTFYNYRIHTESISFKFNWNYFYNILLMNKERINILNNLSISKKDYDFIFKTIFEHQITNFDLMKKFDHLKERREEYLRETINLLPLNKYFNIENYKYMIDNNKIDIDNEKILNETSTVKLIKIIIKKIIKRIFKIFNK